MKLIIWFWKLFINCYLLMWSIALLPDIWARLTLYICITPQKVYTNEPKHQLDPSLTKLDFTIFVNTTCSMYQLRQLTWPMEKWFSEVINQLLASTWTSFCTKGCFVSICEILFMNCRKFHSQGTFAISLLRQKGGMIHLNKLEIPVCACFSKFGANYPSGSEEDEEVKKNYTDEHKDMRQIEKLNSYTYRHLQSTRLSLVFLFTFNNPICKIIHVYV